MFNLEIMEMLGCYSIRFSRGGAVLPHLARSLCSASKLHQTLTPSPSPSPSGDKILAWFSARGWCFVGGEKKVQAWGAARGEGSSRASPRGDVISPLRRRWVGFRSFSCLDFKLKQVHMLTRICSSRVVIAGAQFSSSGPLHWFWWLMSRLCCAAAGTSTKPRSFKRVSELCSASYRLFFCYNCPL